jgi:hypothetical protein
LSGSAPTSAVTSIHIPRDASDLETLAAREVMRLECENLDHND